MTDGGNRGVLGDELRSTGPVRLRLYLLNGVRSAPRFMERLQETLAGELRALGFAVSAGVLFPYDDWSRRLLPQVREVRFDIMLPYRRYERSIGGSRVLADLDADRSHAEAAAGERPMRELTVLVGHSAGGVAAVHAAGLLLAREGGPPTPVVMIGSPKCRIPEPLREAVLYVQAERSSGAAGVGRAKGSAGRTSDPVCRIGSFGGWTKGSGRLLPGWRSDRHAPAGRAAVRIIGGHADYFRDRAPYEAEGGRTNMDETLAAVMPWLEARLAERLT